MNTFRHLGYVTAAFLMAMSFGGCSDDEQAGTAGTGGGTAGTGGGTAGTGGSTAGAGGGEAGAGGSTAGAGGGGEECMTIVEIAAGNDDFSTLVAAATKAGLVDALGGDDLTVFAPTNDAFAALLTAIGAESLDDLSAEQLVPILTYHVADSVVDSTAAIAVAGSDDPTFGTLGGTVALSLDGDNLKIDSATVTTADVEACNGLIHIIDGVIVPSIADMVLSQDSFSSLKGLVEAAESTDAIVEALDTTADLTLFAPENAAIDAITEAPAPDVLDTVLQYHVYAGDLSPVYAADALGLMDASIEMLAGGSVTVNGGTGVTLTDGSGADSMVIVTDLYAANGVVHVIDGVLLPAP